MPDRKDTQAYVTLVAALPELRMVLDPTKNRIQNANEDQLIDEEGMKQLDKEKAVRKIIRHLESSEA